MTEDDVTMDGGHTMQYKEHVLQKFTFPSSKSY